GTGGAVSVEHPLPTLTAKDRFGLVIPSIENGSPKLGYRMLTKRECARGQGFPDSYQFQGTQADSCRQIGNAGRRRLARDNPLAARTKRSDLGEFLAEENPLPQLEGSKP